MKYSYSIQRFPRQLELKNRLVKTNISPCFYLKESYMNALIDRLHESRRTISVSSRRMKTHYKMAESPRTKRLKFVDTTFPVKASLVEGSSNDFTRRQNFFLSFLARFDLERVYRKTRPNTSTSETSLLIACFHLA